MRYRLVNDYPTSSFKSVFLGRRRIGRVCRTVDCGYAGTIGNVTIYAPSELDAFRAIVANHVGFSSAAEMDAKNREARAKKAAMLAHGRSVAREFLGARTLDERFAALDKLETPEELIAGLNGFTRELGLRRRKKR